MEINKKTIQEINCLYRKAITTICTVKATKYVRAIVFVFCWLYAVYSSNFVYLGIPILSALVYVPIIRVICWLTHKKALVESYEICHITEKTLCKVNQLNTIKEELHQLKIKGLKRRWFVKLPLTMMCGTLLMLRHQTHLLDVFPKIINGTWTTIIISLLCLIVCYLCIAVTYWLNDSVILLFIMRKKLLKELPIIYSNFQKEWEIIQNNRKQEERRIKELEQKRQAEQFYEQAIKEDDFDYDLIKQAADLGHGLACLEMAKNILEKIASELWAREEKQEMAEEALRYLTIPVKLQNEEAEFLWLHTRAQYEINTHAEWRKMLKKLRTLKNADVVKQKYADAYEELIKKLVELVDCTE